MNYLCIEFQEEYKRLDRLCKDCLRSNEGVSEYIRQMESTSYSDRRFVYTWEDDYNQLKHIRWIRNQLAHEVGTFNSNICSEEDLRYVKSFYDRIINRDDPFAIISKAKSEQEKYTNKKTSTYTTTSKGTNCTPKPKNSFWDDLVAGIKKLFLGH